MANKKVQQNKPHPKLKQLSFLVGKWHTSGKIIANSAHPAMEIRGMDTYEWVAGGYYLLHRVDVFMGDQRTEVIEIIGYITERKSYVMQSFDNQGNTLTMYAVLKKAGVLLSGDKTMRSTLSASKKGDHMIAAWGKKENGKWVDWMSLKLTK